MLPLPENGNGACCIKTDRYQSAPLVKKFSIKNASLQLEIRSNGQKCVLFFIYIRINCLTNFIKTISSCREKYKLKHEAELFSKSRNYSGCFQPLGQMSYYLGSCIPKLFLSTTCMHALGLLKSIRNIPNCPFFSNDFTFWLITHSHFSNKIPFYKHRHDEQSVKICWRTLMFPMKKIKLHFATPHIGFLIKLELDLVTSQSEAKNPKSQKHFLAILRQIHNSHSSC